MTRWSLFLQTLSLLHHFLGLYSRAHYLGKVPDALGWPIGPCFPVQIDPKAEQFEQVVACADQRPFAVHLLQSPQQELPESLALEVSSKSV